MPRAAPITRLQAWWRAEVYNFRWSDWVRFIDGWIPRISIAVPIIGYLILFNDRVSDVVVFNRIANESIRVGGLTGIERLRYVYFGLVALGIGNGIYRFRRPFAFKFGTDIADYTRTCLEVFSFQNFLALHNRIRSDGHLTLDGKYYDSEWDGFRDDALNTDEGTANVRRDGDWERACRKYGTLLRSILSENFFREDTSRRAWLLAGVIFSTVGYCLLAVPSIDLFIKVVLSSLGI